jgi:uncharacterized protein YceK
MRTPITITMALLSLVCLTGCSSWFKAPSPIDGKPATAAQLAQQQRQLQAQTTAAQAQLRLELEQAQRTSSDARAAARRQYQLASAQVQADTQNKLQQLAAQYEQADAEATSAMASVQASINSRVQAITEQTQQQAEGFAAALAEIDEQKTVITGLLDVAEGTAASFGPLGATIGAAIGLGGLVFGIKGKRSADTTRQAAARVINSIDALREKDAGFDAALSANAELLNDWQGDAGKALVDSIQKG